MGKELIKISEKNEISRLGEIIGVDESSENYDHIAVLMAMLLGLTENTWNGDVVELSVYRAKDICQCLNIPESKVDEVLRNFSRFAKAMRQRNPMAKAFFGDDA